MNNLLAMPRIPAVLRSRPLRFGDEEQIGALKEYSAKVAEVEARIEAIKNGELQEFEVEVSFSGSAIITVLAVDRLDALTRAKDEADGLDAFDLCHKIEDVEYRVVKEVPACHVTQ